MSDAHHTVTLVEGRSGRIASSAWPSPDEFLEPALARCRSQFPRACTKCRRQFASFADYVEGTRRIGAPMLDVVEDDEPLGMLVFANCSCGTTLALCYEDTARHASFNSTVRAAAAGAPPAELLSRFVDAVNALARSDGAASSSPGPDPLVLEIGAAMMALIERGEVVIPPYPAVAFKVVELARSPNASIQALARELSADQALAAAVLLRANSAAYSRGTPLTTLPAAITRLGLQDLARQAMAASMGASANASGPLWALRSHLWHQSLVRAVLTRFLALRRGLAGDEAFLCGLLHSLGSMVGALSLERVLRSRPGFPPQTLAWWSRVLEHFRVQLAGLAAREWRLVPLFAQVIELHRGTERKGSPHGRMLDVVAVANAVTRHLAEHRHLTAADVAVAGAEAEAFARAVPDASPMIAALESRGSSKPTESRVTTEPCRALRAPAAPMTLAPAGAPQWRYRVVGVSERSMLVEGEVPLPELVLTCFRPAEEEPAFDLWALPRSLEPVEGTKRFELVPFALSAEAERLWRQWLGTAPAG